MNDALAGGNEEIFDLLQVNDSLRRISEVEILEQSIKKIAKIAAKQRVSSLSDEG